MQTIDGGVVVSGGTTVLHAGGDGFDSNGDAEITGGTIVVWGPTSNGNGALDVNGTFTISGGTLLAVGSSGMAETPDADSSQGWLQSATSASAGQTVQVTSGSTVLYEFTVEKGFANLVYSSPQVKSGSSYSVSVDGTSTSVTAGQATGSSMGGSRGGSMGGRPPGR